MSSNTNHYNSNSNVTSTSKSNTSNTSNTSNDSSNSNNINNINRYNTGSNDLSQSVSETQRFPFEYGASASMSPSSTHDTGMDDFLYYQHVSRLNTSATTLRSVSPLPRARSSYAQSTYAPSTVSSSSSNLSAKPSNSKKNVNVYTTCGRHSNEWLFSGWSIPFRRRNTR